MKPTCSRQKPHCNIHPFDYDIIHGKALWKQSLFMTYREIHYSFLHCSPLLCQCVQQLHLQFRFYTCVCYLGEFFKNKTHRFQCFSVNDLTIKRVYRLLQFFSRSKRDMYKWCNIYRGPLNICSNLVIYYNKTTPFIMFLFGSYILCLR